MRTLTSQYTVQGLYDLIKETVKDAGNQGTLFMTETDLFSVENEKLFLLHVKEYEKFNHVISRKELDPYALYLLFDLFENVVYNHRLIKKENLK